MSNALYQFFQSQANSGWNSPELLDAAGGGQMVVGTNSDNRVEVFYIGSDSQVHHTWQLKAGAPGGSFSAPALFGFSAKQLAVFNNLDGHLEVFYIGTDDNVYHLWETVPGGGPWTAPAPFGGQARQIAMGRYADGRLQLVCVDMQNNISFNVQTQANSSIQWSASDFRGKAKKIALISNQDNRLELFYIGMDNGLYHNWQDSANSSKWDGGISGAQAAGLGGLAKDLTAIRNKDGRLEIFYIGTNDDIFHNWQVSAGGNWHGEAGFGGQAQQLCLCKDQDGRLEFYYVGMDGNVYHSWQTAVNGAWAGGGKTGYLASYLASTTNVPDGRIILFFMGYTTAPSGTVAAPGNGLGSYSNYLLTNNCRPLENAAVTIHMTQDIVVQTDSAPPAGQTSINGCSWQLNCYSPTEETSAWQQYVIGLYNGALVGIVNNWKSLNAFLVNQQFKLMTPPGGKIPSGYTLTIALKNDADGNVSGVQFIVLDATGKSQANHTVTLTSLPGVGADDLAPIVAFELNLVGPANSEQATFSSGAGTITYTAAAALSVSSGTPPCAESSLVTAEKSNSTYGNMTATPSQSLSQTFSVTTAKPVIKPLSFRPPLLIKM